LIEIHCVGRAQLFAGPAFAFVQPDAIVPIDGIFQGNGLGIRHIGGFALDKAHVVGIADLFGTLFGTFAAGNALALIDIAGMIQDLDLEITGLAADGFDFAEGSQLDVEMPADLDQFGGDNSHGTIIGGKSFGQLGHHPANGCRSFNQVNIVSCVSNVQSGLHAGDTPSHNQSRSDRRCLHGLSPVCLWRTFLRKFPFSPEIAELR